MDHTHKPLPPGPPGFQLPFKLWENPFKFLLKLTEEYGDIVRFQGLPSFILVNHPDHIRHVLQKTNQTYNKDLYDYRVLKQLLGEGLVTSEGPLWAHQRKLMQPVFHRKRIEVFAQMMTDTILEMLGRWEKKRPGNDDYLEMDKEMMILTLDIAARSLMGLEIRQHADTIQKCLLATNIRPISVQGVLSTMPWIPAPSNLRYLRAVRTLDDIVYGIIKERRKDAGERDDLLSMLINTKDEETGEGMNDKQLRDEALTLLLAGHETSATALCWIWYLLSRHPEVEQRFHAELDSVLGGRLPTVEDLFKLPYGRMVIQEAMRIYPPVWGIARRAMVEDEIGGYRIPAGSIISLIAYTMHRHPRYWDNPERFDPERFSEERSAQREPFSYYPFGGGPRVCIGNHFAMMELQLCLTIIGQRFRLLLKPQHPIELEARVTIRPRYGLPMRLQKRQ